jgi:hypothetical protein
MGNTMVKSVFRYLHFLRSYRYVSHYPLESSMAAYKIEPIKEEPYVLYKDSGRTAQETLC